MLIAIKLKKMGKFIGTQPRDKGRIIGNSRPPPRPRPTPTPLPTPTPSQSPPSAPQSDFSKSALLIGSEYVAYASQGRLERLPGCHADLWAIRDILVAHYGFVDNQMTILTDASSMFSQPTSQNIRNAIQVQIDKAKAHPNIDIVLYYSGHGTQSQCKKGDESDGKDECIVPCDFLNAGVIIDDDLADFFVQLPALCKCILITDSCDSGTIFDLPYVYNAGKEVKTNDKCPTFAASIIALSGCKDPQTSASAYNLERRQGWRGAMTVALEEAWKALGYQANVGSLIEFICKFLKDHNFSQVPQVSFSLPITDLTQVKFFTT